MKVLAAGIGGLAVSAHHRPWHTKEPPGSTTTTLSATSGYSDIYEEDYA